MNEGCFQSASLCGKYPYISDFYLHFFGIQLTASFLRERIHSENLYENHL